VATLTRAGGWVVAGSLADARYTLTIHANLVTDHLLGAALDGAGVTTARNQQRPSDGEVACAPSSPRLRTTPETRKNPRMQIPDCVQGGNGYTWTRTDPVENLSRAPRA
jgi:hypothetical protein